MQCTELCRLLTGVALIAMMGSAVADDHLKVAIGGHRGVGESFPSEVGQRAGIFKKHGITLEVLYTEGSAETLQAVVSNSVDVGVGPGLLGTISMYAKGAPVRVIAGAFTGGGQLFWYVRSDSPIQSVKDTEGKTVAYSNTGSSAHISLLAFQRHSGVNFKPMATGSSQTTLVMAMSGQVDVGWAGAPFGVDQLQSGQIRLLWKASAAPIVDKQTIRVVVANASQLGRRREVYQRFIRAYRETQDWVYSTPEGLQAYAEWARLSEPTAKRALSEFMPKQAIDPVRIEGLDQIVADAVTYKYTTAPLTKGQLDELIQIPANN